MALSWRFRRKFLYLLFVLGIPALLIGYLVYQRLDVPPSCFDGKQNAMEIGIDCGGECRMLCQNQVIQLRQVWERPFYVADDVYNLVAYLENLNVNAGIPEIFYEFTVYDDNSVPIGQPFVGSTFVGPGENSVIFVPGFKTGGQKAERVSFRFITPPSWLKTDPFFASTILRIKERQLTDQDTLPKLRVVIENESFLDFVNIPVVAILYNQAGNAIAVSQTVVPEIQNIDEAEIRFSWPQPITEPVARIEVLPRINPFEQY